jgi:quercetin dioxygenase-like cupin family protein
MGKFTSLWGPAGALVLAGAWHARVSADGAGVPPSQAQTGQSSPHVIHTPTSIKWQDGPPSLPPGAKMAILEGDPTQPGPITIRFRVPAGYEVKPHYHPVIEHTTVLSGTLYWGFGKTFDKDSGHAMPAGSIGVLQPNNPHFVWAVEETEVQVHAVGLGGSLT